MKSIIIFAVICFVAAANAYNQIKEGNKIFDECARELDIDNPEKYYDIFLDAFLWQPTDDQTCMLTCNLRKRAHAKGLTLHKELLQYADELYALGGKRIISQEAAVSKIDDCFEQEQEECEIGKCIAYGLSEMWHNLVVITNEVAE